MVQGHCTVCGSFLSPNPDHHVEKQSAPITCTGPDPEYGVSVCDVAGSDVGKCPGVEHTFTVYEGVELFFPCPHCGHVNVEVDF